MRKRNGKITMLDDDVIIYIEQNGAYTSRLTFNMKTIRKLTKQVRKEVIEDLESAIDFMKGFENGNSDFNS
jgi:hypothetical protein